jgi:TonB-dependent starch-binding outer membrane protein SusC
MAPLVDENGVEHPKTVINEVSGNSNSGIATLPGKIKFKDLNGDGKITEDCDGSVGSVPFFYDRCSNDRFIV